MTCCPNLSRPSQFPTHTTTIMASDESLPTLKILMIGPSGAGKSACRDRPAPGLQIHSLLTAPRSTDQILRRPVRLRVINGHDRRRFQGKHTHTRTHMSSSSSSLLRLPRTPRVLSHPTNPSPRTSSRSSRCTAPATGSTS